MHSDIHHQSSSSDTTIASSDYGRAIDRYNPIIQDQTRLTRTLLTPHNNNNNNNNNNSNNDNKMSKNLIVNNDQKREAIVFADENNEVKVVRRKGGVLLGWGCTRPSGIISPASSTRFLLTNESLLSDQLDPSFKQALPQQEQTVKSDNENSCKKKDEDISSSHPVLTPSPSSSARSSDHQVVVLRVSLHCRGCEKKLRKHLSKLEGVTSFTIDFMAKKVTVVGDITPLGVLTSVSKVKNAKLLTPTTISSPPEPQTNLSFSEIEKRLGLVV